MASSFSAAFASMTYVAISSGTSTSTGNFFTMGGSAFFQPSSICSFRGNYLSEACTFVGFRFVARESCVPAAESALDTVPLWICLPRP